VLKPAEFEVWPENEEIVLMFLRCQTQWRSGPSGLIGLDYGVALGLCRLYQVEDSKTTLEGLQIMEAHALGLIAEQQDKAARSKK
jgi:hypothetical protein